MSERAITRRMKRAALLEPALFEEVEHDAGATAQAATVVSLVAVAQAVATWRMGPLDMLGAAAEWLAGMALFAGVAWAIGHRLFHGTATLGELFRALGFAQSAGILVLLSMVPTVGWLIEALVVVWVLWASVLALRHALDVSTSDAIWTGVLAGGVWLVLVFLL